ncbi:MAG: type I 3-dehydroquinate dehydratase [Lachnospiraceae bacterium]|nr:type I 3-dehydroquinate dehydratase [Lachnospiraceae bacterium]
MKTVTVRNIILGAGLPKIAVPLTGIEIDELAEAAGRAATIADLVELRADAFLQNRMSCEEDPEEELQKLLEGVREAYSGAILFTVRTAEEGGAFTGGEDLYGRFLSRALQSGCIDLLDIEFERKAAPLLQKEAESAHIPVLFSRHDFSGTPRADEIARSLKAMEAAGGDIVKGAFMPSGGEDVDEVLKASRILRNELNVPFVLISMGEMGQITRTLGETVGSCLTFGALDGEGSAPGQIDAGSLKGLLWKAHEDRKAGKFLFLTGFMGSGKSTVAGYLGRSTGLPVIEMDSAIEEANGMPIRDIFSKFGQEAFRDMETEFLQKLSGEKAGIVSCGGGAVLRERNLALMKSMGKVLLLTASPEVLLKRLLGEADNRPNIKGKLSEEGIRDLLSERKSAYDKSADLIFETDDLTPEEISERILLAVRKAEGKTERIS